MNFIPGERIKVRGDDRIFTVRELKFSMGTEIIVFEEINAYGDNYRIYARDAIKLESKTMKLKEEILNGR